MQVDAVIRKLLEISGLTTRGMAAACGRSSSWTARALSRDDPRLSTVARVADAAGVDVALVERSTGRVVGVVDVPTE